VPRVLEAARGAGMDLLVEIVGPTTPAERQVFDRICNSAGVASMVRVTGTMSPEALAQRMRRWSLLLLPSYSEGVSLVLLEAFAARLSVATIDGLLSPELVAGPGVESAPRSEFPRLVVRLLSQPGRELRRPDWIQDHVAGGRWWDDFLRRLPDWQARPRPANPGLGRLRRFKPLRSAGRPLMRRLRPERYRITSQA
jgi:glycosyltransferase involved in cell wall biosynthesis